MVEGTDKKIYIDIKNKILHHSHKKPSPNVDGQLLYMSQDRIPKDENKKKELTAFWAFNIVFS